jgi:glycosyltransferase involved in cell wall biosynthesis
MRFPSPELVGAIRAMQFGEVVYEPVDHYLAEPLFSANDRARLAAAEQELVARSIVVTASARLARQFEAARGGSHWLPIGADASLRPEPLVALNGIPRPRLAVVGSLDELADETLLYELAVRRPTWQLVLAGPRLGGWGRQLQRLANVHWLGTVRPGEARAVIAGCDIALNPCVLNAWTESALPVKVFDYLAEGRPVVSTPMAELDVFKDLVTVATAGEFIPAIEQVLATDDDQAAVRRKAASQRFTSQERARRAFQLITEGGSGSCS